MLVLIAGGLAACEQIESVSVGSMELAPQEPAYNYGSAAPVASAAQVSAMSPAPAKPGAGPQVVASYATGASGGQAAGAKSAGAPAVSRSLVMPTNLQEPAPTAAGGYKVGQPYSVDGKMYVPKHEQSYNRIGLASWYGPDFHGHETANGEVYDMNALSAAHQTLPMPCYARVTNVKNGRSVIVRVNDRGPFKHDRIIDLSGRAAELLGFHKAGVAAVRVEYVGLAPLAEGARGRVTASNRPWSAQYADSARPSAPPTTASVPRNPPR